MQLTLLCFCNTGALAADFTCYVHLPSFPRTLLSRHSMCCSAVACVHAFLSRKVRGNIRPYSLFGKEVFIPGLH